MYPVIQIGSFALSTYFLLISLTASLACVWFLKPATAAGLSQVVAIDFTLVGLVCGFAGARLLHVIWEEPDFYRESPSRIIQVWNGGFIFLGGLVGAALATYIFCRWRKLPYLFFADLACLPLAFAYATGRIACLLNGCCYGRHCELPWSITIDGIHRHPTQAYASLWEFGLLGLLLLFGKKLHGSGRLFGAWLVGHSFGRMMMESFRDDPRGPQIYGLSLGTAMSIIVLIFGIILLVPTRGQEGH